MIQLTGDLYYSQLSEIQDFSVVDKRNSHTSSLLINEVTFNPDEISFYIDISKKDSATWLVTFHVINDKDITETKEYLSLYKILMEPKTSLQESLKSLIENQNNQTITDKKATNSQSSISTEFLAGTWNGEPTINKVVILRGGRGFVIFNNGASMDVKITIKTIDKSQIVNIVQNSKPNASFFPELPRQLALESAKNAEPIEWEFSIINKDTISGKKKTLLEDNGIVEVSYLDVEWKRKG